MAVEPDRIVDRHGNVTTLFYGKETNRYARNATATRVSAHDRGGWLAQISYGKRSGAETGPGTGRVVFGVVDRCTQMVAGQPSCPSLTPTNAASFPDVPLDLVCTSTSSCSGRYAPSFSPRSG